MYRRYKSLETLYEVSDSDGGSGSGITTITGPDASSYRPALGLRLGLAPVPVSPLLRRSLNNASSPSRQRRAAPLLHSDLTELKARNDEELNRSFSEVVTLYKPGTLSGILEKKGSPVIPRSLEVLTKALPDLRISPLRPWRQPGYAEIKAERSPLKPSPKSSYGDLNQAYWHFMPPKKKTKAVKAGDVSEVRRRASNQKDPFSSEDLLFSSKSKLANEDLTAYFANPKAWDVLDENEKKHIRTLLPENVPLTQDGAPSQDFLRYNNDWRNGVRLYQEDVAAGRYESEWLYEAAQAMEERARGDYDRFKEREFEQFWGQKSAVKADTLSGAASKIRLAELITAGVFKVGDVWSYARTFGRRDVKFLVEKEVTIVAIQFAHLVFSIPPGRHKYVAPTRPLPAIPAQSLRYGSLQPNATEIDGNDDRRSSAPRFPPRHSSASGKERIESRSTSRQSSVTMEKDVPTSRKSSREITQTKAEEDETLDETRPNKKRLGNLLFGSLRRSPSKRSVSNEYAISASDAKPKKSILRRKPISGMEIVPSYLLSDGSSPLSSLSDTSMDSLTFNDDKPVRTFEPIVEHAPTRARSRRQPSVESATDPPAKIAPEPERPGTAITCEIDTPQALERRLLEIDGRQKDVDVRGYPWRSFYCRRADEHLGTLHEMRQAYYVRKHG